MAQYLTDQLRELDDKTELIDLRDWELPFCDGEASYSDKNVVSLTAKIKQASAVALAVPIYNYDVGGAARNLIALAGSAWNDQIVGLLAAAGGQGSYMAPMSVANSLMLDFRCVIIPRYVYASRHSFEEGQLNDPAVADRLTLLANDLHRFSRALKSS